MVSKKQNSIADDVLANPFKFISFEKAAELFEFSRDVMTALAKMDDFPQVARKVNPSLMMKWLEANASKVGAIRG